MTSLRQRKVSNYRCNYLTSEKRKFTIATCREHKKLKTLKPISSLPFEFPLWIYLCLPIDHCFWINDCLRIDPWSHANLLLSLASGQDSGHISRFLADKIQQILYIQIICCLQVQQKEWRQDYGLIATYCQLNNNVRNHCWIGSHIDTETVLISPQTW